MSRPQSNQSNPLVCSVLGLQILWLCSWWPHHLKSLSKGKTWQTSDCHFLCGLSVVSSPQALKTCPNDLLFAIGGWGLESASLAMFYTILSLHNAHRGLQLLCKTVLMKQLRYIYIYIQLGSRRFLHLAIEENGTATCSLCLSVIRQRKNSSF